MASVNSLVMVSEVERNRALERFRLLRPYLEEGVPLTQLAKRHNLALRTAQRWVERYRKHGLVGLARRPRADRGQRRQLPPKLQQLIEGLALRTPPTTVASVHRQVTAIAAQHGWPLPSYRCVYEVVKHLNPALHTMAPARSNPYHDVLELVDHRDASRPNEIWYADHTLLDIWLRDAKGKLVQPWLTVIMDDYSRAIAGFGLSDRVPSTRQTALVLRQAMWHKDSLQWPICGVQKTFYTDHRSGVTSAHLEQVSADLKIVLVFPESDGPRGHGHIEPFVLRLHQQWRRRIAGDAPQGHVPAAPDLTLSDVEAQLLRFILQHYHLEPHSETGIPPRVRWKAGGFRPRLPNRLEQLDLLLATVVKTRRVQRHGVYFKGRLYVAPTLAAYVGEPVTLRYDPRDTTEIRVYHRDAFLCCAVCSDLGEPATR